MHWIKYKIARDTSVSRFIVDFAARLAQLQTIATSTPNQSVWLGGLFQPEAFVTATRQAIAHKDGCSLEQLVLQLDVEQNNGADAFVVQGEFNTVSWYGRD